MIMKMLFEQEEHIRAGPCTCYILIQTGPTGHNGTSRAIISVYIITACFFFIQVVLIFNANKVYCSYFLLCYIFKPADSPRQ